MFFWCSLFTNTDITSVINKPAELQEYQDRTGCLQIGPDSTSWCSLKRRSFKSLKGQQTTLLPLRGKKSLPKAFMLESLRGMWRFTRSILLIPMGNTLLHLFNRSLTRKSLFHCIVKANLLKKENPKTSIRVPGCIILKFSLSSGDQMLPTQIF